MDMTVNSLGWQPPAGERIVSLCYMRDEIIMATDSGLYVIRYDILSHDNPVEKVKTNSEYDELIMAVGRKFPGESRFETALKYIRAAENAPSECAKTTNE